MQKPPSTILSIISSLSVNNSNAPVLAFNIFSNPSLIGVPGAIFLKIPSYFIINFLSQLRLLLSVLTIKFLV